MVKQFLTLLSLLALCKLGVFGQELEFNKRMYSLVTGSYIPVALYDDEDVTSPGVTAYYTDTDVRDFIVLGIDHTYPNTVREEFSLEVEVIITPTTPSASAYTVTLEIEYIPYSEGSYQDKDTYVFSDVTAYNYEINDIKVNGVSASYLPDNVYLDGNIKLRRYYDFSTSLGDVTVNTIELEDLDCVGPTYQDDQITIKWNTVPGALEYQLEWTFVNNYAANVTASGTTISTITPVNLNYNFKENSTRVSTRNTFYKIPLLFEQGYFIYRVRAVGEAPSNDGKLLYGSWGIADAGTVQSVYGTKPNQCPLIEAHEESINWQVTTTFAEEGKKKEVASYYDGSLRNRQSVTKVNTDESVIVGETIYDHQGRPAVNILPVPVQREDECVTPQNDIIKFYPNFNQNLSGEGYNKSNFDLDAESECSTSTEKMFDASGAAKYYSRNNDNKDFEQSYVPDAKGYPFTVVEYTPDNTGRIRRQSGVGSDFQLGTGRESRYFYGKPDQIQLDRLFGGEVGYAEHYKKNMVIDPNGQISVSYLDQEGRVIATSLAGEAPLSVSEIPSYSSSEVQLSEQMIGNTPDNETALGNVNQMEFSQSLLVSTADVYSFSYDFSVDNFQDECMLADICFSCVYDLTISLTDDCGQVLLDAYDEPIQFTVLAGHFVEDPMDGSFVSFALDCDNSPYVYNFAFDVELEVGNYNLVKNLKISEEATQAYLDYYLETVTDTIIVGDDTTYYVHYVNTDCLETFDDFLDDFVGAIDFSSCNIDCESCADNLGAREDFILEGKGTGEEWDALYQGCMEACTDPTMCQLAYEIMLTDVSPGGQYGEYLNGQGNVDPSGYLLSVFNVNNLLPDLDASWKHPSVKNGGSIDPDFYRNEDGTISYITLQQDITGAYEPEFTGLPLLINGQYVIYPSQLLNVEDFVDNYWQDSWAKSLLPFHPEYCYYEYCIEFEEEDANGVSSQDFDAKLRASDFEDAVNYGWLVESPPSSGIYVFDILAFDDPMLDNTYVSYSTNIETILTQILTTEHQTVCGSALTTLELAAFINNCGSTSTGMSTIAPGCTDFGTDVATQDAQWTTFVALYLSKKDGLINDLYDSHASVNWCINDCIGNEDFNPFFSMVLTAPLFSWNTSLYAQSNRQPCGMGLHHYYANKQKRFSDPEDLTWDDNEGSYQLYQMTGQCPIGFHLDKLLAAMAQDAILESTSTESLNAYPQFVSLYLEMTPHDASPIPASTVDFAHTSTDLTMTFNIGGGVYTSACETELSTGGPTIDWGNVINFSGLQAQMDLGGGVYEFTINATVDNAGVIENVPLTGTTCFDIINCQFGKQCELTDFAKDIEFLFSALATDGYVLSSHNIGADPNYTPILTPQILTTLNPASSIQYSYNGPSKTGTFQSSAGNLTLEFSSVIFEPGYSGANVFFFDNLQSLHESYFSLEVYDINGDYIGVFEGTSFFTPYGGTKVPFELGICEAPLSYACENVEFKNLQDLYFLLNDVLVVGVDNIEESEYYTHNLETYFGSELDDPNVLISNDTLYIMNEEDYNQCGFIITSESGYSMSTLVVDELLDITPSGDLFQNSYYEFVLRVISGSDTINLNGSSCIPVKTCTQCLEGEEEAPEEMMMMYSTSQTGPSINSSYSEMKVAYEDANTLLGYEEGDSLYIEAPSLKEILKNENEGWILPLTSFAQNFNPKYDDVVMLQSLKYFKLKYRQPVEVELHKYKKVIDSLNAKLPNGHALAKINDSLFQHGKYAEVVGEYAFYVDSMVAAGDTSIESIDVYSTNRSFMFTLVTDTCSDKYDAYVALWNTYWDSLTFKYAASGYEYAMCRYVNPMFTYSEFYDICSGPCSAALDYYVASFEDYEDCPQKSNFNITTTINCTGEGEEEVCDTTYSCSLTYSPPLINCSDQYEMYLSMIGEYNASVYASDKSHSLTPLSQNEILCGCYEDYLDYLFPYLSEGTGSALALPVDIDEAECDSECSSTIYSLNDQIDEYNNSPYAHFFGVYLDPVDVNTIETCSCVSQYILCLEKYTNILPADLFGTNLPSPIPFSEETCGNCCGGHLVEDAKGNMECVEIEAPCDDVYDDYVEVSEEYNLMVASLGIPGEIEIMSKYDYNINGWCKCMPAFISYIESVLDGTSPFVYGADPSLNPSYHCAQKPCTPDVINYDTIPVVTVPYVNPCEENLMNIAYNNALTAYGAYIDSVSQTFIQQYQQHCKDALSESFTKLYEMREHHYTLYYYDQAGNLIKTIPPEGISFVGVDATNDPLGTLESKIQLDRKNHTRTVYTDHRLATKYVYNSLNQLVKQSLPDHDQMEVLDYTLVNGLDANLVITEIDFANDNFGLLTAYKSVTLANSEEVDRGYLYMTNDGGHTWNKMNDLVAGDIHAIQFIDQNTGFAVGKDGLMLKSVDGGNSWDMVDLYSSGINGTLNDLYLNSSGVGLLVGDNNLVVSYTDGGTPVIAQNTFTVTTPSNSNFNASGTDDIVSIIYDSGNSEYVISITKTHSGKEWGAIYNSGDGLNWTAYEDYSVSELNDVSYINTAELVVGGNNGLLMYSDDKGSNWWVRRTNVSGNLEQVCFFDEGIGVAVIDAVLYATYDGGENFEVVDDTRNYLSLNRYEQLTDRSYAMATCDNGDVVRVLISDVNPVAIDPKYVYGQTTQLHQSAWAVIDGSNLKVMVTNGSTKVAYTGNYLMSSPVWQTINTGLTVGIKDIKFTVSSGTLKGAFITTQDLLFYFTYVPGNASMTITQMAATDQYSDLSLDVSSGEVIAYNVSQTRLDRVVLSAGTLTTGSTLLEAVGGLPMWITNASGDVQLVSALGELLYYTGSEENQENFVKPLPINDLAYSSGSVYGAGDNGHVIALNSGVAEVVCASTDENLNALTVGSSGESWLVGDNGMMVDFDGAVITAITQIGTSDLQDVIYNSTCDCSIAVGDDGAVLERSTSSWQTLTPITSRDLNAVGLKNSGAFYAGGNYSEMISGSGNYMMPNNKVFGPALYDVSALNTNRIVVSASGQYFARRTVSGGSEWNVIVPDATDLSSYDGTILDIKEYASQTFMAGSEGYYTTVNQATNETDVLSSFSSTVSIFEVEMLGNGLGLAVGVDGSAGFAAYTSNGGTSWTTHSGITKPQYHVHGFEHNGTFISVGAQGSMYYYDGASYVSSDLDPDFNTGTTDVLIDVDFYDDAVGYAVGITGTLIKTNSYSWNNASDRKFDELDMTTISLTDATGIQANNTLKSLYSINVLRRDNIVLGGVYDEGTSDETYARILKDESQEFSTYFYYDKLGRIVVSQNSRQFDESTEKFSYTRYDDLGRVVEAGEKTENDQETYLHFDRDYIDCGLSPRGIGSRITMEAWVRTTYGGLGEADFILSKNHTINKTGYAFDIRDNKFRVVFSDGNGGAWSWHSLYSSADVNDGEWHHLTGVIDSNVISIYIDGVLDTMSSYSAYLPSLGSNKRLYIGQYLSNSNRFRGDMKDIRVWSDARSSFEILNNMGRELTGNENNLVAYYNLNEGSGTVIGDNSNINISGTFVSGFEPTWVNTDPIKFNEIFGSVVSDYYNPNVIDDTKLASWINGNGPRTEVTQSYYDVIMPSFDLPISQNEDNLRKRIGSVTYEDVYDGVDETYNYASHYDYDIHGNVKVLIQDNRSLLENPNPDIASMRFKRMDYDYDLISGNVHQVSYQRDSADQWHHKYAYDGDNRITAVSTSDDELNWDEDARYFYYDHGPLARVELGENNVQGVDYAYTLQGWLKGVNSDLLDPLNDIGKDGLTEAPEETENYLSFDQDHILCGDDDRGITSAATFEAWIRKPSSSPSSADVFLSKRNTLNADDWVFLSEQYGTAKIAFRPGTTGAQTELFGTTNICDNEWHHISGTIENTEMKIYVDGVLEGQTNAPAVATEIGGGGELWIGNFYGYTTTNSFEGDIKEVSIWNQARTASEILSDRDTEFSGSESGLVGYYKLNEGTGTTVEDLSTIGIDGTFASSPANPTWDSETVDPLPYLVPTNPNQFIAKDAFGFSLHYFDGEYQPISTYFTGNKAFTSDLTGSDVAAHKSTLYNGNIGAMVTSIKQPILYSAMQPVTPEIHPQATGYQYDQLNRLMEARAFVNLDMDKESGDFNQWQYAGSYDGRYFNSFVYDANGNIEHQLRNDQAGNAIDSLKYYYAKLGGEKVQNRLYSVRDIVDYDDEDIDDMGTFTSSLSSVNTSNNYRYDPTGQLVHDASEEIEEIVWRVDGKIKAIVRTVSSTKQNLVFEYDPMGNRIAKHVYGNATAPFDPDSPTDWEKTVYYNRDAQGNVMAVYEYEVDDVAAETHFTLLERNIYGSSRVGMNVDTVEMIAASATTDHYLHLIGKRQYELSNHLGNVLSVVTDRKFAIDTDFDDVIDYYEPDILLTYDYSPFGVILKERNFDRKDIIQEAITPDYRWTFDAGSLVEVNGSGHDVTLYNTPTQDDDRCTDPNNAYLFDGSNEYGEIADHADFDFADRDFTLAVWVKRESFSAQYSNMVINTRGTNTGWALNLNTGSYGVSPGVFSVYDETNTVHQVWTTQVPGLDTWYHLVGMRDGDSLKIFLDGEEEGQTYVGDITIDDGTLGILIGRLNTSYSNIVVDDIQIFNRALTDEAVAHLYDAGACDYEPVAYGADDVYRYTFNGMEKDDEVKGAGNSYDFGARMYDSRLGRFLSIDQLASSYPWYTPYQFAGNMPIAAIDMDGKEEFVVIKWVDNNQLRGVIVLRYTKSSQAKQLVEDEYLSKVNYYTQMVKDSKSLGYSNKKAQKIGEQTTANLEAKLSEAKAEYENKLGEQNNVVDENYNQVLYVTIECVDDECSEIKDLDKNANYYLKNFDEVLTLSKYDGIKMEYKSKFDEGDALMMDKGVSDAFTAFQEGEDHGENFANHMEQDINHYLTVPISSEAKTNFATGSYELTDEIKASIKNSVYRNMLLRPNMKVEIVGHTDIQGSPKSNQVLSEKRAEAVVNYLIELGISSERLSSKGEGGNKPLGGSDADDRRVEFIQK